jgi:hypothetical protein
MSITSYSELQTAVGNWLNRADLTTYVPDLIMLGERRIYRKLRIRTMETALNLTMSSGVAAVPSDYLALKSAYIDGTPVRRLQRRNVDFIYEKYPTRSSTGKPDFVAREATNFIFGPFPDSNYTMKGVYYARLPSLSVSNTTNFFITYAPDVLLWAALSEAEVFLKNDARVLVWQAKFKAAADEIQEEDDNENASGGPITAAVSWQ